jgi:cobaltochelatase CobS
LGGQSIDGFKEGKLIDCWKNGKILILDEMPKLDPNTAGLFNDALAKSSKTKTDESQRINSANTSEAPIPRNKDFGIIATGNIYPNTSPPEQYRGNNQQDLSLLDRFSGSVYYTEFNEALDQKMCRFEFLYKFLVGNYHTYIKAKNEGRTLPAPLGLRTIIEANNMKNLALVSYRTEIAFRVAFEYELVRAIARKEGKDVQVVGKTLAKTFESYMVAFRSNRVTYNTIITASSYTESYITNLVKDAIAEITSGEDGFKKSLTVKARETANPIFKTYKDFLVSEQLKVG